MKIKIFVALVAIAIIAFISCNWFRSKKKNAANPLLGEWKLDSVKTGKDSNVMHFLVVAVIKDSAGVDFSFTKDFLFTHSKDAVDTVGYSFDEKVNQLNIKDSASQSFVYSKVNDSLITLTTKDSAVLFLQKK